MFLLFTFTMSCVNLCVLSLNLLYTPLKVRQEIFFWGTDDESGTGRVSLSAKTCGQRKKELTANSD